MKYKVTFIISLFLISNWGTLSAQTDPDLMYEEIESMVEKALDYFSLGEYDSALIILNQILDIEPTNKRVVELIESINELYNIEKNRDIVNGNNSVLVSRPEFNTDDNGGKEDTENSEEDVTDDLEKPDFSVRDDEENLLLPEDGRSSFDLFLSPNLVFPSEIGEEAAVFPEVTSFSAGFNAGVEYYLNLWDRILGVSAGYSLMLLNPETDLFASNQLHIIDALISFRTFFSESYDSRIILKISAGYRGYFSSGYSFNTIGRSYLNGINMGIALELPILYLFLERDIFKRIILDLDMNLLFFPEFSTLNLFDHLSPA